jgi:anaerobic magnesium-protoporphyrin IX monomethyl ester cyclase
MKTAILYPPFRKDGELPLLTQNRHLKFSKTLEVRIFPLVPGHLATNLQHLGHEVLWLDGINRRMSDAEFDKYLSDFKPDIAFLETKAPVVKRHWAYIQELKDRFPNMKTVLMGDHVSYFPSESLENSVVDYVMTGGDYDIVGRNLVEHLAGKAALGPGVWYRDATGKILSTGPHKLTDDLDSLPFIDRELTRFLDYGEAYLLRPTAYILTGRGCGAPKESGGGVGLCTFCIWQHALWGKTARLRSPGNVAAEMEICVNKYKVWEFFDDNESGPIYNKEWLKEFYKELKSRNLLGRFQFSSNCRADNLNEEVVDLLVQCGWRLLKIGLESGSDYSIKHLAKCETVDLISRGVKMAKDKGLRVLLTTMMGYPWETEEDVKKTYAVTKDLLLYKVKAGDCMQASVVIAYPGSPLWKEATRKGWLLIGEKDYEKYDMSHPILKTQINASEWATKTWNLMKSPKFVIGQVTSVRSFREVNLLWRGLHSLLGHVKDYGDPLPESAQTHATPQPAAIH